MAFAAPVNKAEVINIDRFGPNLFRHHFVANENEVPVDTKPFEPLRVEPHRLWRWKAFRLYTPFMSQSLVGVDIDGPEYDFPLKVYERMLPAIRLATILLDRAKVFMIHIQQAPIVQLPSGQFNYLPSWSPQRLHWPDYDLILNRFAGLHRLMILPMETDRSSNKYVSGTSSAYRDPSKEAGWAVHSCLSFEIISEYASDDWDCKPESEKENMWALLAQLLVHELAHAIHIQRSLESRFVHKNLTWMGRTEPHIPPVKYAELGHMVIAKLFGFDNGPFWPEKTLHYITGAQQPHLPFVDGRHFLSAIFYSSETYGRWLAIFDITPQTVHSFFNQLTWQPRAENNFQNPVIDIYLMPHSQATWISYPDPKALDTFEYPVDFNHYDRPVLHPVGSRRCVRLPPQLPLDQYATYIRAANPWPETNPPLSE